MPCTSTHPSPASPVATKSPRARSWAAWIVYLCLDRQTQRPVALKTFRPEYLPDRDTRDRSLREGTTWLNLGTHPHIVRAYGVERIGDGREDLEGRGRAFCFCTDQV